MSIQPFHESSSAADTSRAQQRGWWLGLAGVLMFALTIPMTRLANGTLEQPQLDPSFVAVGRAALAGLLASAYLLIMRAPWPSAAQWRMLALNASGVVLGFPLCMGLAVRQVDAVHASVVTGLLPLATAVGAAWWLRQRPAPGFWLAALLGAGLVLAYAAWKGGARLAPADALLLAAVALGAMGYVTGAQLAGQMPPQQVISWSLVLVLPASLPWTLWHWPAPGSAGAAAWAGFVYVALVSMWLGFFAWYRGLALGGTMRVSQVQLLQPFLSMAFALPLLGERTDLATLLFALAVLGCALASRRLGPTTAAPPSRSGSATMPTTESRP